MIGIDILETSRIEELLNKKSDFLNRTFTVLEQKYFANFNNPIERICGCFCAKEAIMKALMECQNISFLDIEITHNSFGAPIVNLSGVAKSIFDKNNFKTIEISISHSKTIASAIAKVE